MLTMGALNSILDVDTFLLSDSSPELNEKEEKNNGYTPTCVRHKRLLDLDPRSPSEAISRTPIVIEKTPASGISATPEPLPMSTIDPRSPTSQFLRTPIIPTAGGVSPAGNCSTQNSHFGGIYASSESGIDSRGTSPDVKSVCTGSLFSESTDSVISHDTSTSSEENESPEFEENDALLQPHRFENADANLKEGLLNMSSINRTTELCKKKVDTEDTPKCVFRGPVDKRVEALSNKTTVRRSPLAFVENSPRSTGEKHFSVRSNVNHSAIVDKENQF